MAFRLELLLPDVVPFAAAGKIYASIHLNAPHLTWCNRPSILIIPSVLPGMSGYDPSATPSERCQFVLDADVLFDSLIKCTVSNSALDADGWKELCLDGLYSGLRHKNSYNRLREPDSVDLRKLSLSQLAQFELCVTVHLLTPVKTVAGRLHVSMPDYATSALAGRCDEFETTVAEASISVCELAHFLVSSSKKSAIQVPLSGNGSGAIHFLKSRPDSAAISIKRVEEIRSTLMDVQRLSGLAESVASFREKLAAKTVPDFVAAFLQVRQKHGSTMASTQEVETVLAAEGASDGRLDPIWKMARSLVSRGQVGKIYPHRRDLMRTVTYLMDLYGKPETVRHKLFAGITVPIWYYLITRSVPIFACPVTIAERRVHFFRHCMRQTLRIYGLDGTTPRADALRQTVLKVLSLRLDQLTSESKTARVALGDVIATFLSMPGWMGKYHSDIGFDPRKNQVVNAESLDDASLAGFSSSDDCEGKALVVKEFYVQFICMYALSGLSESQRQQDDVDRFLGALSAYLHSQFDLFSCTVTVAGNGISESELKDLVGVQQKMLYSDRTERDLKQMTERTRTCQESLRYDNLGWTELDLNHAPEEAHETCLLIPVKMLWDMSFNRDGKPGNIAFHDSNSVIPSTLADTLQRYLLSRLQVSSASDVAVAHPWHPPSILLEGTWPTSPLLAGPSLWSIGDFHTNEGPQLPKTESELTQFQRRVIRADEQAAHFAQYMRSESLKLFKGWSHRLQAYNVFRKTAGFLDSKSGKIYYNFPEFRHYSSSWYRSVAHGVNVTMLENVGSNNQHITALAHTTFINGDTMCFGIPMDEFMIASLSAKHPAGPGNTRHQVAHVLARAPADAYRIMDLCEKELQWMQRRPPVNTFSVELDSDEIAPPLLNQQPQRSAGATSLDLADLVEHILSTRLVLLDADYVKKDESQVRDVVSKFMLANKTIARPFQRKETSDAAPVELQVWKDVLYPDFCRPTTLAVIRM